MKDKEKKMLFGIGIVFLFLATVSLSYAYFSANITNKDVKDQVVETGTLRLTYTDGPEIKMLNIKPGSTFIKEVSVKNTGTLDTAYNLVWQELSNEITNDEMVISATCERRNANGEIEETCEGLSETAIGANIIKKNIAIESGVTHKYVITITFKETSADQNYNQNKKFSGVLGVNEYKVNTPKAIYCTFDGELTQGAEYVNGQYTYRYMQEYKGNSNDWSNITKDGWGVTLTDKTSTDPVTSEICTYINEKPIISASYMYYNSQASTIDLSSFNTSNVNSFSRTFEGTVVKELDVSNFVTKKVRHMDGMFQKTNLTSIDVSNFDTSYVGFMNQMFYNTKLTEIKGLENFDTSMVLYMNNMFWKCPASVIDVSNFDTSSVTDMSSMFSDTVATTLDVSKFNTSKVTSMSSMFSNTQATILDVSNFDTSNVTNMGHMFSSTKTDILDLSSFNTSKVKYFNSIFYGINAKTIYASDKFTFDSAIEYVGMFSNAKNIVGGAGTVYNSKKINNEYAHIDGGVDNPGYFTLKTN